VFLYRDIFKGRVKKYEVEGANVEYRVRGDEEAEG
jgi:hypothetical protein